MNTFERAGVRFQYPSNWQLDLDEGDDGWTVSVQSPETAFLVVSLRSDVETAAQIADETLSVLRAEYTDLDAETAVDSLGGQPAIGHDIDFVTLDATITCWTRCVDTSAGPLLVMGQTSEYDRELHEPVLRAIRASIQFED